MASTLDPAVVLAVHPTAWAVLGSRALAQMAFWMALWMALVVNAKARATDDTYLRGQVGDGRHKAYMCTLSWIALNPLLLSNEECVALLRGGTRRQGY